MGWRYEIDEAVGLIRFCFYGVVSDVDLLEADQALRKDPEFRPDLDQIVEVNDGEEGDLTMAGIRELTSRPPLFSPKSRRAIVVRTDLGFGLARVFQTRRGEGAGEIRVFRDPAEAEIWLSQSGASG